MDTASKKAWFRVAPLKPQSLSFSINRKRQPQEVGVSERQKSDDLVCVEDSKSAAGNKGAHITSSKTQVRVRRKG